MLGISGIGVFAALLAGTVSFLSPCVLPLVPGYLSYIVGRSVDGTAAASRGRSVWLSLLRDRLRHGLHPARRLGDGARPITAPLAV